MIHEVRCPCYLPCCTYLSIIHSMLQRGIIVLDYYTYSSVALGSCRAGQRVKFGLFTSTFDSRRWRYLTDGLSFYRGRRTYSVLPYR